MKAELFYTLSRKYSIAKLWSLDNGTRAISINFYGLLFVPKIKEVHPERVEKHILEDEKEAREYIRQAWAEAMVLYRNGSHELKLSGNTEQYMKEMQKEFMPEDSKVGIIQL